MFGTERERNEADASAGSNDQSKEASVRASGDQHAEIARSGGTAESSGRTGELPSAIEKLERELSEREDPLLMAHPLGIWWRLLVAALTATGGAAGGSIGWAVATLGCEPPCGLASRLVGAALGASLSGLGMAVLGVLIARSFTEWAERSRATKVTNSHEGS